jgi:glycosyltransferase involved in cell wall biosynthesis
VTYTTDALREDRNIPASKSTRVPNGVDTDLFSPDATPQVGALPDTEYTVGYVGTNREWVDLPLVLDALSRLREDGLDVGFLVVGEEGGLQQVRQHARKLGIDEVCSFVGTVPYSDVPTYLTAMDVGTIPFKSGKIGDNSMPLKLFEYMACGVPVASTPIRGVEDAAGNIVTFGDGPEQYEDALRTLLTDRSRREEVRQRGLTLAESEYSWTRQVERIDEVLNSIA